MKLAVMILLAGLITATTFGCRTARGFGEDMERAGEKIQEKADR